MRIEAQPQPSSENVPTMLTALIQRIQSAPSSLKFIEELDRARNLQTNLPKTELARWSGVLDRCDELLEQATTVEQGRMPVDKNLETKKSVVSVLKFTAVLFECTSTRRVYASMDRLLSLLDASDLSIVADVLRLLQTIGKRSKYLPTRLSPLEQTTLVEKLTAIAQCWSGRLRNMKMVDTLSDEAEVPNVYPYQYSDGKGHEINRTEKIVDSEPLLTVVDRLTKDMESSHRNAVLAQLRTIRYLNLPEHRMHCLIIKLLSISTLIYCRCHPDENQLNALVFPGFVDEVSALLKVPLEKHPLVDSIQAESLRTLTAIVSLDKTPKVNEILEGLGANSYHGFIANFTRMLVEEIKTGGLGKPGKPSNPLATALFSFIYHVSNNESGGEKLMTCGLTQTLLSVIEHKDLSLELLSFATRCCRIIDTFTGLDVSNFRTLKGMNIFLDRIVYEINECRKEQPFVIETTEDTEENQGKYIVVRTPVIEKRCHQLRVGLIKGLLTFVKRVINVPELQENVRHIMEGSFPDALIHIISNVEYYSDSVYHHTLLLVTNFIYQEPTQLTQLQSKHVPYVMLQSLLRKELPNSRDVIGNLGNVFTALCLNETGLNQFKSYKPFEHVFKVLLSTKFLATIKKKRAEMSDSASNIGAALDDLLRHQPTLKPLMLQAVITALDNLNKCATEPPPNTKIVMAMSKLASRHAAQGLTSASGGYSPAVERIPEEADQFGDGFSPRDDESDDDDEADLSMDEMSSVGKVPQEEKMGLEMDCPSDAQDGSRIIPLGDYCIIFTKIITQANTNDLTESFVQQGGIEKLLELTQIQTIAQELSSSTFSNSVANILQYLLSYAPAGKQMMDAFNELFSKNAEKLLLDNKEDPVDCSYLLQLGTDAIKESTSCINRLIPILSCLTRMNSGPSQYTLERKGRIHEAWLSTTGKIFHQKLRRASRHLSWEATLIKLTENPRVSEGTQTDPQSSEKKETEEPKTEVDSVAVEPGIRPPEKDATWETAKIPETIVTTWRENKEVGEGVIKANKLLLEFLNLLARSCYCPLRRNRRYDYNTYSQPKQSAQLAEEVFSALYLELKFSPKDRADSPMEYGRITDLLYQLTGVLFDERRQAFHPMLDKFYSTGLHTAFCDALMEKLAPGLDGPIYFQLDTAFADWFKIAERLANRQKIVNTIYKHFPNTFDPEKYIRLVQSDFFRVLSELFTKMSQPSVNLFNYQGVCEEAISVFKEVARGLVPKKIEAVEPSRPIGIQRNDEQVQALMEMGFDREEIIMALARVNNFEEAAEYLVTRQAQQQRAEDEAELFIQVAPRGPDDDASVASEDAVSVASVGAAAPIIVPLKELKIEKDISISQACIELMPLCKRLMELGSELVFSCADLFISVEPTLDMDWKTNELLRNIMCQEVSYMAQSVILQADEGLPDEKEVISLATRLHFSCLLFEHVASEYLRVVLECDLPSLFQKILSVIEKYFDQTYMHDKLLPTVVLWLDLYDKYCRLFQRRSLLITAVGSKVLKLKWSWLGDDDTNRYRSNKRWVPYSASIQELINAAFFDGKTRVTYKKGDKELVLDFGLMSERDSSMSRTAVNAELLDDQKLSVNMTKILEYERKSMWTEHHQNELVKHLTSILKKKTVYSRAIWSILSFLARLTRDKEAAELFLKEGGVTSLIQLKSDNSPCSSTLTSLILRQCVDTNECFRPVFEKAIRQATATAPAMEFLGLSDGLSKPKEWHETLNKLTPLSIRQPETFADVMSKTASMKAGTNQSELVLMTSSNKTARTVSTESNPSLITVVNLLLTEVLIGDFSEDKSVPVSRMFSQSAILNLVSEICKTYQGAALLVTEAKHENQKTLLALLEKYIAHEDKDTIRSLKILIAVLATCNHSPKAQETLVSDLKTCIQNIYENQSTDYAILQKKLTELCSLISAMAEPLHNQAPRPPTHTNTLNPILKLFHKKKICNDLVKTITLLRFNQKGAVDAVSEILRTMEVLMRYMNAPSPNATVEDLVSQARRQGDRALFSFEELLNSHFSEEERRRIEDMRVFDHVRNLQRDRDRLQAEIVRQEAVVNGLEQAVEGEVENRHPDDEMREEESSSGDDEEESDEQEVEEDEDEEEQHEVADLDLSQDEADATMEVVEGHAGERQDDTEEDDEDDEDGEEEEDDDDDEDEYENDHGGFEQDRERYEDMYDYGMDGVDMAMDEWDLFPQAYLSHFNRMRERRRPNAEAAHPLLIRPQQPHDATAPIAPFTHQYDYPTSIVFGIQPQGGPLTLTRQNAIRRIGGTSRTRPVEHRRFFDRLFDSRDNNGMATITMGSRDDDQRLRANVPSALDRMTEAADLLDSVSIRYIGVLINAWVTKIAKDQLAAEKLAKEVAVEEERKKKEEAAKAAAKEEETNAEAAASSSSTTGVAPPSSEVDQAWIGGIEQQISDAPTQDEPMDVTEANAVYEEVSDAPLPSSTATLASSILEDDSSTQSPAQMDTTSTDTPMETESAPEPEPAVQEIPEEFRAILGDMAVPEGVDVAFLAALPDDMRAEVLRDHERQQRAQRAAAAPPPQPPVGQHVVAVPAVEPLDQEFLNALPPELQEEILQQHERAVREAEEAIRRANEPALPAQPELDGAAVIASLPSRERAQVLAEMEDAELQRLPQEMQEEARRARAAMAHALAEPIGFVRDREIQRGVMRIHNLYVRGGPRAGRAGAAAGSGIGGAAGRTHTASTQAMQLLERESIVILCGLFLIDHRVNSTRLQKVLRLICSHAPSCDFVIWCLQGFLDKASEGSSFESDDVVSTGPGWLDSIGVPGLGLGERCAKIAKNGSKVYVNPLISPSICRNVVETLNTLARCYPGHFVPTALRSEQVDYKSWPERALFWQLLQNPTGKGLGKEPTDARPAAEQFSSCPFTHFFHYFENKLFKEQSNLQDKLFRVINAIAQTLPEDTSHRLTLSSDAAPMKEEAEILIDILSRGICGPDGFSDGRLTLMELMRVLPSQLSEFIYDKLCESITQIGLTLQPQIEQLMKEMNEIPDSPEEEPCASTSVEKGKVTSSRLAGEGVVVDGDALGKMKVSSYACAELRLPAMMALTDKHGAQYSILSSLHTLTKLRDSMRQRKQKRIDEEKKKTEEAAPSTSTEGANTAAQNEEQDQTVPQAVVEKEEKAVNLDMISVELPESRLSSRLSSLENLWTVVSSALLRLGKASDPHAVLALQPIAEAFFLTHAVPKASTQDNEHPDNQKMIAFAEMHREVLNQVLRQNSQALASGGPFAFLTQFPKLLDFDVKRKYFRKELSKVDTDREYRRSDINVQVRRSHLFSDSFRELYRLRPAEWKKRFYIVFQGEEGQDAGGLLREWFSVITREIFNPNYALFITAPGDMVTYMINKASYINPEHLDYFKFVGRIIGKALYDSKLLDCYFTRAFYKHILNVPIRYQDIESEDPAFFNSLEFLLNNPINDLGLDLTFSLEVEEFGVRSIRDLKENGRKIDVTDENKEEYVNLVCQMKMTGSIQRQLDSFLQGFYEIIPKSLISMFNEQELELLISGLPDVDINDLSNNTEYKGYTKTSPQIQWFWRALRSFEPEDRAKFLQFVTGTSKVPLQGFSALEGMNGVQKFSIHMDSRGGDRLPAAHTCFNQLDLPQYESYEKLRNALLTACTECTVGFGFA